MHGSLFQLTTRKDPFTIKLIHRGACLLQHFTCSNDFHKCSLNLGLTAWGVSYVRHIATVDMWLQPAQAPLM